MNEVVAPPLHAWESYYVIVGSSAAALTGLQFVVMTLIAEHMPRRGRDESISAFGSPNVVHFCAALVVASILSAPWSSLQPVAVAVSVCGALGVGYSAMVLRRALRQREYRPVFEDWLWHTVLPALAYGALLAVGPALRRNATDALFVVAGTSLLLVLVGIHNAWDTVTFIMTSRRGPGPEREAAPAKPKSDEPGVPGAPVPRPPG